MSWSLGEAKSLATKAARGVGLPWGMAEEASSAVHWLQANGAPGIAALAEYLAWRDGLETFNHDLCPISLGTALMDAGRAIPERLGTVRQPLLLAPFLAASVPSGIQLSWGSSSLTLSNSGFASDASRDELLTVEADCSCAQASERRVRDSETRVPDDEATSITRLEVYAARTYAPATEQSRLSGAGAGTSDND